MTEDGFTIIELLVACAMLLAIMGLVGALATPLRDGFERSLGAADLTGGSRTVLDRLAADIREAGSGASVGGGRLASLVEPIVPLATIDSSSWADPAEAFRVTRVPLSAPQGRLLVDAGSGSIVVTLDTSARCTSVGAGCGLRAGASAILYDTAHTQAITIDSVSGGVVRFTAPLTSAFAAGSVLASITVATYGLRPVPGGAFRLVRLTAATEQPLIDDVVGFSVSVRGADPFHPREVDLALRLEAPSASMRGPAGRLFRRPGTALRASSWVPDVELRTTVAVRNGAN